jgi:nicotinamidase-related amidase
MTEFLPSRLPGNAALIVIDVQKTFDLPRWAPETAQVPRRTSPI